MATLSAPSVHVDEVPRFGSCQLRKKLTQERGFAGRELGRVDVRASAIVGAEYVIDGGTVPTI